ncbi:MAG: hypothetical protein M3Y09_16960 [Actinomycetota bacterium]|nr:hypothetical protein [Actinomycetota bacterium]
MITNVQSRDAVDLFGEQTDGSRSMVEGVLDQAAHGLSDALAVCEHAGRAGSLGGDEPAVTSGSRLKAGSQLSEQVTDEDLLLS